MLRVIPDTGIIVVVNVVTKMLLQEKEQFCSLNVCIPPSAYVEILLLTVML